MPNVYAIPKFEARPDDFNYIVMLPVAHTERLTKVVHRVISLKFFIQAHKPSHQIALPDRESQFVHHKPYNLMHK